MNRGLTLLELMVAVALTTIVAYFVAFPLNQVLKASAAAEDRDRLQNSLTRLHNHIAEIGRISSSCFSVPPAQTGCMDSTSRCIVCTGEYNAPEDMTPATFRFAKIGTDIQFGQCVEANPITICNTTDTKVTYTDIAEFESCGTAEFLGGTCPILPARMNQMFTLLDPPGPSFKPLPYPFFRYRIVGQIVNETTKQDSSAVGHRAVIQGSFFIRRNQMDPFQLRYRRGLREN